MNHPGGASLHFVKLVVHMCCTCFLVHKVQCKGCIGGLYFVGKMQYTGYNLAWYTDFVIGQQGCTLWQIGYQLPHIVC